MGQRYIPDSFILGQMVSPAVGTIPRRAPEHFTTGCIPDERIQPDLAYTIRAFPRGLDVFSVLGSERAEALIAAEGDDAYPLYSKQLAMLRKRFSSLNETDWNRNLYWSWLYALKTLVEPRRNGYQAFQKNSAWLDRKLSSALASWAALRHDTILYAKQSYTPLAMTTEAAPMPPPPPPPPKGLSNPNRFSSRGCSPRRRWPRRDSTGSAS